MGWLDRYRRLAKTDLCLMVACSAAFGFLLAGGGVGWGLCCVTTAVFLLACSGASLNSIQERGYDALFRRTATRPLVTGEMGLAEAWAVTLVTVIAGMLLLLFTGSLLGLILGLGALIVYNGVYTPLKRYSEFSLLAGGVSGALPPLIGWSAAGGSSGDPVIWSVMALFFLWQPPHFCLLLLEQRDPSVHMGCFVNLASRFSTSKVKRFITVWLLAFTTVAIFFTAIPGFLHQAVRLFLLCGVTIFTAMFLYHLHDKRRPRYRLLFVALNSYLVWLMVLITIGTTLEA